MQRQIAWILIVGAFAILSCLGMSLPATAAEACHTHDAAEPLCSCGAPMPPARPRDHQAFFAHLRHLGFSEVILQWTAYGSLILYSDAQAGYESQPYLGAVVHAAQQHRIKLWLGLHYDPEFWSASRARQP